MKTGEAFTCRQHGQLEMSRCGFSWFRWLFPHTMPHLANSCTSSRMRLGAIAPDAVERLDQACDARSLNAVADIGLHAAQLQPGWATPPLNNSRMTNRARASMVIPYSILLQTCCSSPMIKKDAGLRNVFRTRIFSVQFLTISRSCSLKEAQPRL